MTLAKAERAATIEHMRRMAADQRRTRFLLDVEIRGKQLREWFAATVDIRARQLASAISLRCAADRLRASR